MPYRLRKAPGRMLYWVVGRDGSHMSKDPIPLSRAKAQMRALYASERQQDEKLKGGRNDPEAYERQRQMEIQRYRTLVDRGVREAEETLYYDDTTNETFVPFTVVRNVSHWVSEKPMHYRRRFIDDVVEILMSKNINVVDDGTDIYGFSEMEMQARDDAVGKVIEEAVKRMREGERFATVMRDLTYDLRNKDTDTSGKYDLVFEEDLPLIGEEVQRRTADFVPAYPDIMPFSLEADPSLLASLYYGDATDSKSPELEGEGLGDIVRGVVNRFRGVSKGIRRDYPPAARQTIAEYGNGRIVGITVRRTPIQGMLNKFLNLLSLGSWNKAKAAAKFDNLYHLSMVAMVQLPEQAVVPILIEKNQVINISPTIAVEPNTQFMNVDIEPGKFTLSEFLQNGQNYMGDRYFLYDGYYNNCQDYLISLLRANGINDANAEAFIKQPLENLIKNMPWYSHAVSKGLTDLAAMADVVVHGEGKKSEPIENMRGAGKYSEIIGLAKGDLEHLRNRVVRESDPKNPRAKYEAESQWEERIINAAAQMAGLPNVVETLSKEQKCAYVHALRKYLSEMHPVSKKEFEPRAEAPPSNAIKILDNARNYRAAEHNRTAAAVAAMAAPKSRAFDSTTTEVRPISSYALRAANLPGVWNPYDFGTAATVAANLERYERTRQPTQQASQERREQAAEVREHALDRQESRLIQGSVYLPTRPAGSLDAASAEIAAAFHGMPMVSRGLPSRLGAAAASGLDYLRGAEDDDEFADMPPLEVVEEGVGAMAAAAPAAAAAAASAAAPMLRMDRDLNAERITTLFQNGFSSLADLAGTYGVTPEEMRIALRGLPEYNTNPEFTDIVAAAEGMYSAQMRAEADERSRLEADAAAADGEVRAEAAREAPRDAVTGEGYSRPALRKPATDKVVMKFKDFKNEHQNLVKLLSDAVGKLSKEAKEQAHELKTYEVNKMRRGLHAKKTKEIETKEKRGRGRPKGSKNKKKGSGFGDIISGIASAGETLMKPVLSNLSKVPGLLPPGGQQAINAGLDIAKSAAEAIPARSGDDIIISSLMGRKRRGRGEPRKKAMEKLTAALKEKPETEAKASKELEKIHSGKTIREREENHEGKARVGKKLALEGKGEKWIQEAVEKPGAFSAQAKRAKMSVAEFAEHVLANPAKYKEVTRKRAQFAKNMEAMAAKKKRKSKKGKEDDSK